MSYLKLSAKKRALLEVMLREKGVESSSDRRIPRRKEGDSIPLSFAQQRLWFFDQFEAGKSFYNLPGAIRLKGKLNVAVLEQTFNEIVNRHEALRSTFTEVHGQPVQVIAPPVSRLHLPVIDLRELPQSDREAAVKQLSAKEAQQPFDLELGPLLRTSLLQLSEEEYVLLLTMHHIVSDGWSIGVLARELAAIYEALWAGNQPQLPELPVQYADFAIWQRNWLCGEVLQTQLAYWKQQLEGAPPLLELPADRPRPPIQTSEGATQSLLLSFELTAALKNLSQREDVTLFMTLLAAFKALLYRYTGRTDLLVGSPIANRNRAEIEGLIGVFVNTLVLRTDVSGDPTFRELLQRLREVTLGAYAHQDLPFEKLVEELQPERSLSYNPVFQVMFQLRNNPMPPLDLPGLTLSMLAVETNTTQCDLSLDLEEVGERLQASVEYSTDLFDRATITRMLGHLQTLLEGIAAHPEQRLSSLPLLTAAEKQQLLEWNNTNTGYLPNQCPQELFEKQVEQTPDAPAAAFDNQQLTYRQLNAKANQIAHYLQKLGARKEVLVGVCADRSLEAIAAFLGVLKAGAAYLPLDPAYPPKRLAYMLEDARAPLLLTQQHLLNKLPPHSCTVVCLDADWEQVALESEENPSNTATPENLAYVTYTSGSTGRSKGVAVNRSSLVNAYLGWETAYGLRSGVTSHLQMASFSFDVFSGDLMRSLCSGGKLVLCDRDLLLAPQKLYELMRQQKIDFAEFVPAVLRNLIQYLEESGQRLDFMKILVCGSDSWYASEYEKFRQFCGPETRLINSFGITEATIDSCYFESATGNLAGEQLVPIGRPFPNTQLYILDAALGPVPIGVPGELHVGGAGLARGYLNRPELTAEKFIANPFCEEISAFGPSNRLYKTGDLARYLPDGNIELIGRIDNQVKIRGFRIELAEIEAVLSQHPAVRENAVLVWEEANARKRLVAYVVPDARVGAGTGAQPLQLSSSELRQFLQERLPEYMVPSAFVLLEKLPLTPNGKLDRAALPAPDLTRSELEETFAAPCSGIEQQLASIWMEVLGIERVGIHDNFFELGGDSILSIQIVAKANRAGIQLTPKLLFQHQTIAFLAAAAGTVEAVRAEQKPVTGAVPLTPVQQWFFEENFACGHHWNQAVMLEVRQPLEAMLLERAFAQLLTHHDALRLRFAPGESGWQQFNAEPGGAVPFEKLDLSNLLTDDQTCAKASKADEVQASLNLSEGPIARAVLFDLGAQQPSRLLIVIHHLAVDGVSWRILLEDLQNACEQLSRGLAISLPPKTTSFKQWAQRLVEYARSEALHQEFDYWLGHLQKPISPLPVDFAGGSNAVAQSRIVSVAIAAEDTNVLLHEVPKVYRTQINDVLLAALAWAFAQWTREQSLLVDLDGHGREDIFPDADVSRTVGWFTSVFPVLLSIGEASTPADGLKAVKEQLRAIPNRGMGYGLLRYLAGGEISQKLISLPPAEVSFNYFGQFDQVLPESSLFALSGESVGQPFSPEGNRSYLIEINGFVAGGQLRMDWTYSEEIHRRSTVENLAQKFAEALRAIALASQEPEAVGCTPSDFAEFKWSQWTQNDLEDILSAIGKV
ncbi:non-ribosomal peptide synthetase [Microcoleus vaginatus]|uniref:non-ribosomal peptide synthetase n=1 Tax=Microcoleus vaginatus TaxID=119532 RepID=UPI001683050E|nr:amino acid adenylation domain-containing protein [Microcoleus sp. FACHB-84]